jgi:hypothetical protein
MKQFLISVDQTLNTCIKLAGEWGMADECISARCFRLYLQGLLSERYYLAIDAVFFWQKAHCYLAWVAERERRQLPNQYYIWKQNGY